MSDNVPTDAVGPVIDRLMRNEGVSPETLASRAGMAAETVYDIIRSRNQMARFDNIDRLLVALNGEHLWYTEPALREVYDSVDLSGPGMSRPRVHMHEAPEQCFNGHDLNEENLRFTPAGRWKCRVCERDYSKRSKARQRGQR